MTAGLDHAVPLQRPLPRKVAHFLLDNLLSLVQSLFEHYDRSSEVDEDTLADLAATFSSDPKFLPAFTENEIGETCSW